MDYKDHSMVGDDQEESIDEILKSIRGLVYPSREALREPIVDLNRPVREEEESFAKVSSPLEGKAADTSAAVHAMSSFMHVVKGSTPGESFSQEPASSVVYPDPKISPLSDQRDATPLSSLSLETFLRQVIEPSLSTHMARVIDEQVRIAVEKKLEEMSKELVRQWISSHAQAVVERWIAENGPSIVVKCVETYLKKLTGAASGG